MVEPQRLFVVAPWDDSKHPIIMRYQPGHKAKIHQKIVEDASERVRAEGLSGAAVAAAMQDTAIMMPSDCCGGGGAVQGQLDNVTVSQALDYVLQTFPGFWVYENCVTEGGERSVYFNFH